MFSDNVAPFISGLSAHRSISRKPQKIFPLCLSLSLSTLLLYLTVLQQFCELK